MINVKEVMPVKLVVAIFYGDGSCLSEVKESLQKKFGDIDYESDEYLFNFTDYYESEMGKELKKRLISFKQLINRDELAEIKIFTNKIEEQFCMEECRMVNLDPGYLTLKNVVLASTKERPHKVSIGRGIFGDVVLTYKNRQFISSYHTFPDFKKEVVQGMLGEIRERYKKDLKEL